MATTKITSKLTFLRELVGKYYGNQHVRYALYRCECGREKEIKVTHVAGNYIRSCGCIKRTQNGASQQFPEYRIWDSMNRRCISPSETSFERYGARGITVCERWRNSFEAFLSDMGPRPSAEYSIERDDNNGPYDPDNCHWATLHEQSRNKRNNRYIQIGEQRKCLHDWLEHFGMSWTAFTKRTKKGWSEEMALTTPLMRSKIHPRRKYECH